MTFRTPTNRAARRAFTIVELLVVTAVALILMSILATAHSIGLDALRNAKAQGDLVDQQRMALSVLRRDLMYNHFLEEDGKPNLGRRLSDQRTDQARAVDLNPAPAPGARNWRITGYKPPKSGYFKASSIPAPLKLTDNPAAWAGNDFATWNWYESEDSDGFASSRSGSHFLQFTIIVPGGAPENTLTADVPFGGGATITGRAAEVAYFLKPNGATPTGVAKYSLIRRQRLTALNDDDRPAYRALVNNGTVTVATDPPEVMAAVKTADGPPLAFEVFHLNDLTLAANRLATNQVGLVPITVSRIGEDVLLSNVTSFEIKFTGPRAIGVTWPTDATSTEWPRPFSVNTDYPYDNLPYGGEFDTFNSTQGDWTDAKHLAGSPVAASPELKPIRITGVMIRLRGWDSRTRSSRQTTIAVDL